MTQSQVSNGFWSNAPKGLENYVTFAERTHISLKLADSVPQPENPGYQRDDGTWYTMWLPRPKGGGCGFSGGWRAFAIDMDLYPSDVCVFEVVPPKSPGSSSDTLIVHIFRAFDYDEHALEIQQAAAEQAAALAATAPEEEDDDVEEGGDGGGDGDGVVVAAAMGPAGSIPEFTPSGDNLLVKNGGAAAANGVLMDSGVEVTEANGGDITEEDNSEECSTEDTEQAMLEESKWRRAQAATRRMHQSAARKNTTPFESATKKAAAVQKRKRQTVEEKVEEEEIASEKRGKRAAGTTSKSSQPAAKKATTGSQAMKTTQKKSSSKGGNLGPKKSAASRRFEQGEVEEDDVGEAEGDEEAYFVERIMGVRTEADGTKRYLIKWWGYSDKDNSWEPAGMLDAAPETYRRAPGVQL